MNFYLFARSPPTTSMIINSTAITIAAHSLLCTCNTKPSSSSHKVLFLFVCRLSLDILVWPSLLIVLNRQQAYRIDGSENLFMTTNAQRDLQGAPVEICYPRFTLYAFCKVDRFGRTRNPSFFNTVCPTFLLRG